ncbi:Cation-transporting P-type ATPase [Candidatus Magnetomoraceae bacterium gMMP-1]
MIYIKHSKVYGRARYKVTELYKSNDLKIFLEAQLVQREGILSASASSATGNILVRYNSDNDHSTVAKLIENILDKTDLNQIAAQVKSIAEKDTRPPAVKGPFLPAEKGNGKSWHIMNSQSVMSLLKTDKESGLSGKIVTKRLHQYGLNVLPEAKPRADWKIFVDQFASLPVALLGVAAGVSAATGGILDAAIIMGVAAANAFIGFFMESQAEKTISSLKNTICPYSEIIRDGVVITICAEDMVPGDILLLKPGTYVTADCRIIEACQLSIDESALTGESMPVYKSSDPLEDENVPLSGRMNMAYMGTLVTGGSGIAVVVSTGINTEIGRLQVLLGETTSRETPIERRLRQIGDKLVISCIGVSGVVFVIGFFRGYGFVEMIRMAVSLAGAAVPEGLPTAATITFALGIQNMKRRHVMVRQLQAVETLGAIQTVCLDKTGTITWNRMTTVVSFVGDKLIDIKDKKFLIDDKEITPLDFKEFEKLLEICALCNESGINGENKDEEEGYVLTGSPTENALVQVGIDGGLDVKKLREAYPLIKIKHRAENRLFMGTIHEKPDGSKLFAIKGSPVEVLEMCKWHIKDGIRVSLTEADKMRIELENEKMAGNAIRVLGVAFKDLEEGEDDYETEENGCLNWVGLIGMVDPIRDGVTEFIEVLHEAGINTVMITGDQLPTAYAVAEELNISMGEPLEILDSKELSDLSPEKIEALAKKVHVFSRVTPAHKLQIVKALQASGSIVAMTGDGINDGPALKAADIGIAMGHSGTDIAREVADVVLERDNLETVLIAIRDGRTIRKNIKKSVHFFLSTNMSEVMIMFSAMAGGMGFPLNTMQLLWINLISDIFPGIALSLEDHESDVMDQPPHDSQSPLFTTGEYKRMIGESAVITGGALGAYGYGLMRYGLGAHAGTLAFQSLTIGQLLHAISCRSETHSIFSKDQPPANKYFNISVGGSLAAQLLTMAAIPGVRSLLGITPLGWIDSVVLGASTLLPLIVNETTKNSGAKK